MLLPTLEEFGIRRPFDAPGPGRPEGLGGRKVDIGGTEWPMMSRTMTYVGCITIGEGLEADEVGFARCSERRTGQDGSGESSYPDDRSHT